ncbi:cell envelope biogenesis protein TonB [Bacteroidia bacterium]|nr:cell envelope biogenesis protein TonB [Bacteroidia bacterium]GHT02156.1 cell envelope biogenesis protein TonB [Bacteroidia bacterium]GHT47896.1 cell envelope biogenesis protein TonB [Bacteroidia bacterium]
MAQDFDLTSQRWLDLVFEGKNKQYGAYVLREESSNRHLKSLIIVAIVGSALIFLPNVIKNALPKAPDVIQTDEVTMVEINQEIPEEDQIKQAEPVPPPPLLKETVQFTPPVIKRDEEVQNEVITQTELTDNKADISVATVEGSKDGGVDIADLQDHKVVVQEEKKPEIFSHVEVPPSFPGGDKEMMKWLQDNISYPVIAQEQGIQGRVILRFVVGPDGSVGQVEVQRSLDPSCDKEAQRVVKKMPKWIPGKQNGNAVYVYYTLPVLFKLQN